MVSLSLTAATGTCKTALVSSVIPISTNLHQFRGFISVFRTRLQYRRAIRACASTPSTPAASSPGLYSSSKFDLTPQNVDLVLEDVRPYLISDGGNVDVVSVDGGVISLKLQGPFTLLYSFC